jgi:hypothetical protein
MKQRTYAQHGTRFDDRIPVFPLLSRSLAGCGKTKFFEGDGLQAVRK